MSRISDVFAFDEDFLNSKLYRAALKTTWRQISRRRQDVNEVPPPSVPHGLASWLSDPDLHHPGLSPVRPRAQIAQDAMRVSPLPTPDVPGCWIVAKLVAGGEELECVPSSFIFCRAASGSICSNEEAVMLRPREIDLSVSQEFWTASG